MEVEWKPFFLHPETPPEGIRLSPQVRARFAAGHERLDKMAQGAGLVMVHPDFIPNSRRALEASEYARTKGKHEEYHRIVFVKFYGEGQDIHEWPVLRAAAEEAGLDADEMEREVESEKYHDILDGQIGEAQDLGVTAVPTYVVDDTYAIVGAQPYEVFERVLARLAQERQANDGTSS